METTYELNVKYPAGAVVFKRIENAIGLFCSDANFSDDSWLCDKKKESVAQENSVYTIYFSSVPDEYKTLVKHFSLLKLNEGKSVGNVKNHIKGFVLFAKFLKRNKLDLINMNNETALVFKKQLVNSNYKNSYKHGIWSSLNVIFSETITWEGTPNTNYFKGSNPFPKDENHEYKYIPCFVINQLDKVFRMENIPLYLRVFYWIARSIPSRANEVLGMNLDCLKPYGEDWVIIMPTWKQNGGYIISQIRRIYLKYEGHGKFLIDLIRAQQEEAKEFQGKMSQEDSGMLFAHARYSFMKRTQKYSRSTNKPILFKLSALLHILREICNRYNVTTEEGKIYNFTTHQLRHNGITDRLYAGFTPIQIALMTDHQTHEMIIKAYNHEQKEKLIEKQKLVYSDQSRKPVYFKGRILNMDECLEKRLLTNIRAYRINELGICSDITGCEGKIFECFDCDLFVPDAKQLFFFEEQVRIFEEKIIKFKDHPYLRENAEYNLELHKKIIERIKSAMEGVIV